MSSNPAFMAALIRARRSIIAEAWERDVRRSVPELEALSRPALLEHIHELIERVAESVGDAVDHAELMHVVVDAHALQRLRHGLGLDTVIREYAMLRQSLLAILPDPECTARLDQVIDGAIARAAHSYWQHREALRERFIGILAHDLRSPLMAISVAAELLMNAGPAAGDKLLLDQIVGAASRMHRMVLDVLSFARGYLGDGVPIARQLGDFGAIVEAVVNEARIIHGHERIRLDLRGDLRGLFDRDRVHQVVSNLVRNALEHGTGLVHVIASEADDRQGITLVVKNQGAIARTAQGAHGLGLYIVDEIARAHGASVEMSSSNGETVFAIHWPRPREVAPSPAVATIEIQRGA